VILDKNQSIVSQFKDLKVLELASVLAGPSVGQFFAELGADVIKVENINTGGDVTRTWKVAGEKTDDRSAYFSSVNWGKRSVALDLHLEKDRAIVHKLAARSEIIIASYKPGDAEKLGVDYETLSGINPRVIYGQISGYGSHNPRVGYDAIIQAEAGFMYMNGELGGPSIKMPVALMDVLAGHHLKEGLLLAMLEKTKTGKGKLVEVSLIQAGVSSLVNQATNWLVANKLPQKHGSAHPNIAPYGDVFTTQDSKELLLAVGNDRQFQDLCKILEIPELGKDVRFVTNTLRVENRTELNMILTARINQYSSIHIIARINEVKIPAALIQDLSMVFDMPEAQELILSSFDRKGVRNYVGTGNEKIDLLPPPHLGQHNSEIINML
jgi:crotonobetainyl-CoA:carnitine CoA-transferase CaiB-like acyl-CoA transferase